MSDRTFVIPELAEILAQLGITDVGRVVPRQVTLRPVEFPGVIIIATAMGLEYDVIRGTVRIAITGGMRNAKPLRYLWREGFNGGSLVWEAEYHDNTKPSFLVKISFGPAIGLAS